MKVAVAEKLETRAFGTICAGETFIYHGEYFIAAGEALKPNKAVNLETGWIVEFNHYDMVVPKKLQVVPAED